MKKQPNIIVYLSDQQRADTMGCYGQRLDISPTADELAKEGVLFEHAYTCQPVCGPARSCLQTGKFPTETGTYVNHLGLKIDENTIAKELARVGYETAYIGKWHLSCDIFNGIDLEIEPIPPERMGGYTDFVYAVDCTESTSHGYDGYVYDTDRNKVDFIGYRCDCITDFATHYIRNKENEKPFFMFLSHIEPHQQNDHDCYEGPDGSKERFKDYDVPKDLLDGKYEGDFKENYPDYLGACRSLDDNLQKLINTLKHKGIYEDTIIIYSSDHGNHFGTQDGEYKRNCFDSCLHIPLIIAGGHFKGGKKVDEIVSLINLPTTILSLANVDIPNDMRYKPLQEVIENPLTWTKQMFFQVSETELGRGIRTHKWKYYVHAPHTQAPLVMEKHYTSEAYFDMLKSCKADSSSYIEKCLFDLENDPYEKNNLVADPSYADIRKELSEVLKVCMVEAKEEEPQIFSVDYKF